MGDGYRHMGQTGAVRTLMFGGCSGPDRMGAGLALAGQYGEAGVEGQTSRTNWAPQLRLRSAQMTSCDRH